MIDPDLVRRFEQPGREYSPTPLWWWSGAPITREQLSWQLDRFAEGGIHNFVVINLAPKGPLYGAPADDPPWFSDAWWDLMRHTCDEAAERGISIWFYDQIGFSGANLQGLLTAGHPEMTGRALHARTCVVDSGGLLDLHPGQEVVGVYAPDGSPDRWRSLDVADGRIDPTESGREVRLVYTAETAFDYLRPDAVDLLIDYVHGEFERRLPDHLGSTIVGSFQDELPGVNTWTPAFLETFREEAGYDLTPHLPALWETGEQAARIRGDYHRVRTALAERALFRPLAAWHERHGMLLGCDQMHPARLGHPRQGTQLYADYMATHRWYSAAGSDHEGDAKIHGSLADLYDHPRVWIEAFHSSGWGGTLAETWDWLLPFFRRGANLYNPHASYYTTRAGWFEWAPPSTDYRQPYYAVYGEFAAAVSRACSVLTWARHVVDVAVLHPVATVQATVPPDLDVDHVVDGRLGAPFDAADDAQETYRDLVGTLIWYRSRPGALDRLGLDFDVIDDDSLQRATVGDATLDVNGLAFRTVILPSCRWLDQRTAARLLEFAEAGGRVVVVGNAPEHATGRDGDDAVVARLVAHDATVLVDSCAGLPDVLADLRPAVRGSLPVYARRGDGAGVAFVPAAYPNASTSAPDPAPGRWGEVTHDPDRYADSATVTVGASVVDAEVWNPATGERRVAPVHREGDDSVIDVAFNGAPAVFVAWQEAGPASGGRSGTHIATALPTTVAEPLEDGWTGELVPTADNRWGDFALPATTEPLPLEVWSFDWRDGDASPWQSAKATFGQEVLVGGPYPVTAAPAPLTPGEARAVLDSAEALGGTGWAVHRYSATRGVEKDPTARLGSKGIVEDEFVHQPAPADGEVAAVRTVVRVPEPGDYVLVVGAAAAKRIWLNGVELGADDGRYVRTEPVRLTETTAVLEYHLTDSARVPPARFTDGRLLLGSFFGFAAPGTWPPRPELVGPPSVTGDRVTYATTFDVADDVVRAVVIVGAAGVAVVEVDGTVVGRQQKVEYYVSRSGTEPKYFTHDVPPMAAGRHEVCVVADAAGPRDGIVVDLVLEFADGTRKAVVSDPSWRVDDAGDRAVPVREMTAGTSFAHAATRPHPLPGAHWLTGDPAVGEKTVPVQCSVDPRPRVQRFRLTLPAGASEVSLPVEVETAFVDGRPVDVADGLLRLDDVPTAPVELEIATAPRAFGRGGAAWAGPARVITQPAPIGIGDWANLGLGSFSGGVRYTRTVTARAGERLRLDLGRVRGSVRIAVNGSPAGAAFCPPYRFDLTSGLRDGDNTVEVVVYNTLAPRFAATSPTIWIYPAQLSSGLLGPVTLERGV